jgi:hypothetical protein
MQRTLVPHLRRVSLLAGGVALVAMAFLLLGASQPAKASPLPAPAAQAGTPSNAECLACHSQEDMTLTLPSSDSLSVTVDPAVFGSSVHGMANISCVSCHTDITGYPHPEKPNVVDRRDRPR